MNNNFNLIRLLLAAAVIFSHSFPLTGNPGLAIHGDLGNVAVRCFFAISGYLICLSYLKQPLFRRFAINRFLRIAPGFVVAWIISTALWSCFGHYVDNPVPYVSNGPIWTLTWEAACYMMCAALGIFGVLTPSAFPAFFASAWLVYLLHSGDLANPTVTVIAPLFLSFLGGSFIAIMGKRIDLRLAGSVSLAIVIATSFTSITLPAWDAIQQVAFLWGPHVEHDQFFAILYTMSLPFAVIYLGECLPAVQVKTDISYGVYIYGWPASQVLVHLFQPLHPMSLFALTMIFTAPIALVSWKVVEQPALRLKAFKRSVNVPTMTHDQPARPLN